MSSSNASIIAHRSWSSWFNSRDSATYINKQHLGELFSTFDFKISKSECIEALSNHPETVFAFKANFGVNRVGLFHHFVGFGGTLYDSSTKQFGFIQGLGKSTATNAIIDEGVLSNVESDAEVNVPTTTNMMNVTTIEQVDSLNTSTRSKFRPRNFIPVPPFLLSIVDKAIQESNGDVKLVLLECIKGIKKFDEDHAADTEFIDKAKEKCKDFLLWLFLIAKNDTAIAALPTMGCTSEKLAESFSKITMSCLDVVSKDVTPDSLLDKVEQSLKRPFEVLAASSSSTSDFMEKLTQLQSQSNEKSSKSFKRIPTKYQNMILVASSVSEITVLEYDADGKEFFKSSSILNAQVMLNSLLESEGIDCSVSSAMTAALALGSFLWKDNISPSGFASAVISSESFIRSDTLHEGMILDYSTKFEMSETALTKLTKTQILFPSDVEELTHRIRGFHLLACFFFKKTAFISQGLKKVSNFCLDNKVLLRTRIFMDKTFIAKFICSIDERVYYWLRQCSMKDSVLDTDITLVEFSSLIADIQLNRFNYILPPSVTKVASKSDDIDDSEKETIKLKKSKTAPVMVRNNDMNTDWKLRPSESWGTVFRNNTIGGPVLSKECKPCLKYHVKGVCYQDCVQKASHCVLIDNDKEITGDYIKQLRGE